MRMPDIVGEQFGGDMPDGAGHVGIIDLVRVPLGIGDQLGDCMYGQRGVHHQHARQRADQADGGEILARVVARIGIKARIDRERAGIGQQNCVSVGGAARRRAGRDGAAGAAAIVHHDLLAERLAHPVRHHAAERIIAAAGRERHHHGDRPRRIGWANAAAGAGTAAPPSSAKNSRRRIMPSRYPRHRLHQPGGDRKPARACGSQELRPFPPLLPAQHSMSCAAMRLRWSFALRI